MLERGGHELHETPFVFVSGNYYHIPLLKEAYLHIARRGKNGYFEFVNILELSADEILEIIKERHNVAVKNIFLNPNIDLEKARFMVCRADNKRRKAPFALLALMRLEGLSWNEIEDNLLLATTDFYGHDCNLCSYKSWRVRFTESDPSTQVKNLFTSNKRIARYALLYKLSVSKEWSDKTRKIIGVINSRPGGNVRYIWEIFKVIPKNEFYIERILQILYALIVEQKDRETVVHETAYINDINHISVLLNKYIKLRIKDIL